jgi:hypothetical protein
MSVTSLDTLAKAVETLPDPRSKQGVSHPYHGMVALVLIGLIAGMPYVAQIRRWAKKHWYTLRETLKFKKTKPPVETTIFRALAKTSVAQFQDAFAEFLKNVIAEDHDTLVAAVDGKAAKQMKDENGDPLLMLNVFAHELKVTLMDYSVRGEKTNEPGCLKIHLEKLFSQYPFLKLLTGDAIFAQRPLLEVLQEHGCDYLFQVKENQGDAYEAIQYTFQDTANTDPDDVTLSKKKERLKFASYGATSTMRNTFASS